MDLTGKEKEESFLVVYEKQKEELLGKIADEMTEAVSKVQTLNRNMEHLVEVGKEFERISKLWKGLHDKAIQTAPYEAENLPSNAMDASS